MGKLRIYPWNDINLNSKKKQKQIREYSVLMDEREENTRDNTDTL